MCVCGMHVTRLHTFHFVPLRVCVCVCDNRLLFRAFRLASGSTNYAGTDL